MNLQNNELTQNLKGDVACREREDRQSPEELSI